MDWVGVRVGQVDLIRGLVLGEWWGLGWLTSNTGSPHAGSGVGAALCMFTCAQGQSRHTRLILTGLRIGWHSGWRKVVRVYPVTVGQYPRTSLCLTHSAPFYFSTMFWGLRGRLALEHWPGHGVPTQTSSIWHLLVELWKVTVNKHNGERFFFFLQALCWVSPLTI